MKIPPPYQFNSTNKLVTKMSMFLEHFFFSLSSFQNAAIRPDLGSHRGNVTTVHFPRVTSSPKSLSQTLVCGPVSRCLGKATTSYQWSGVSHALLFLAELVYGSLSPTLRELSVTLPAAVGGWLLVCGSMQFYIFLSVTWNSKLFY